MHSPSRNHLLLGTAVTLSLGIPFLLVAVAQQAMSTQVMAAVRVAMASATLLVMLASRGQGTLAPLRHAIRQHSVALTTVALTAAVAPNLLIGSAEHHIPSGTAALLVATTPLWIAIGVATTRSGERISARQWVALPLALLGVAGAARAAIPGHAWVWCVPPLLAAFSYTVSLLVLRRHLHDVPSLVVTTAEMLIATVVLTPFALTHPGEVRPQLSAWVAVTVAGVGCSGLGWLGNTTLTQRVGASRSSVVSYTSVVVSVVLGVVVLDEPLTARVAAGTAILVAAVALFIAGTAPRRTASEGQQHDRAQHPGLPRPGAAARL